MKFGGTSVAKTEGWQTIRAAASRAVSDGDRALVVCSALSTVSNRLERLIRAAVDRADYEVELQQVEQLHHDLAAEMGVPLPDVVVAELEGLRERLEGVRLLREASPRVRARIMASGELMSTRLGTAWLRSQGVDAVWVDARTLLTADDDTEHGPDHRRFLSARVSPERDPSVDGRLPDGPILITQGFIASDPSGETVLLGRGGSDTSAACFGALLGSRRVEIWTDVPGMFSTNPQLVRSAAHLEDLGYDEAATMASLGAKVLHPRCLEPVCDAEVPLHVRSTYLPDEPGTVVGPGPTDAGIKAVTSRKGLVLLRLCRPSQWQPVGFVADVSACFKRQQLSIDLMSTSPSTIAVTIDPASAPGASLDALLRDLQEVCEVSVEREMASVSLVGTKVREAAQNIGGALLQLDGIPVAMVAQGADDHHLTFIVEQRLADPMVRALHRALFPLEPVIVPAVPSPLEASA